MPLHYDVRCRFTSEAVALEWVDWLHDEHLQDVCDAGATSARVVRVRADEVIFEARYVFPDSAAFATYEAEHAPRLRSEGLQRFPLERGLTYSRTVSDEV